MGLNVKEVQLRLCKVVQVSYQSSYTFLRKHPIVSGALSVCFILYILLSYIYRFLAYLSPFLVCAAIFVRIFWSSEQTQLRYIKDFKEKGEKRRVEPKYPKIPNNARREMLHKYPSQSATSRRRNLRYKKWDVYGGLEEKAKDLSAAFHNEFTKGESSLDYGLSGKKTQAPKRQTLRSEPSMVDLVECGDAEIEKMEYDEDEEDAMEEERNKPIEWTEDDQNNLMDLGNSEMERNRRLESLIARRREKKLMKMQLESGLIDKRPITSSNPIAPLLIKRGNPKDFEGIDDLEMPGSAPSYMPRSPYDIPYDPCEERPNLTEDSLLQEYTSNQKDNITFCRHGSFSLGPFNPSETNQDQGARGYYSFNQRRKYSDRLPYSRFRSHPDKGNHDWLIDQLLYNEGGENGSETPNPVSKGHETTHEENGKCETSVADMKVEEVENAHEAKSMSNQTSKSTGLVPNISNVETTHISEKSRFCEPHKRLLNLPESTKTARSVTINESSMHDSVPSPVDKRQEMMFLTDRRVCHTPTYSIASDLQVEVSEVGSPTSTIEENANSNSTSDRDSSILYDGDIDRDVSSGSEDLWGASFHGTRGVRSEENNEEVNNSKDIISPISLRQIDEENVADVSSMSSRSDLPEDTPTCARSSDHHNIFGYMKYSERENESPQSSISSSVSSHQTSLIGSSVEQLPEESHSVKPKEYNQSENLITESLVINDVSISAVIEQNNNENTISNEDPSPSTSVLRQESVDEGSNSSIASSPRSVLPEKTIVDEVSSSASTQQLHTGSQHSEMEFMAQETLNGERPPNTIPQNFQPLMVDTTDESHNLNFNYSQEQTNPLENSTEGSNILGNMNDEEEVSLKEEQDKSKNDEISEDNSKHLIRQENTAESTRITTMEDTDDTQSRDLVDDRLPSRELVQDDKIDKPASSNIHEDLPEPRVVEPPVPVKEANEGHAEAS
ncbi:uncharacterized protein LOC130722148 isoform X2 [Lotus japonicus]|uniref:uncharacterized protein LOC130722148 isoform X2 n=1 Tax=Lotus japonicus TaxID=34305 RepID=UPI00258FF542|nr:uncharacterized protein LOC130722148 isoform X2 [Lotus japonicus]